MHHLSGVLLSWILTVPAAFSLSAAIFLILNAILLQNPFLESSSRILNYRILLQNPPLESFYRILLQNLPQCNPPPLESSSSSMQSFSRISCNRDSSLILDVNPDSGQRVANLTNCVLHVSCEKPGRCVCIDITETET